MEEGDDDAKEDECEKTEMANDDQSDKNERPKPQSSQSGGNDGGEEEQENSDSKVPQKREEDAKEQEATADDQDNNPEEEGAAKDEEAEVQKGQDEEKVESDALAEEELKLAPAEESVEAKESDLFAHKKEEIDDDVARATLDDVKMEELDKTSKKVPDVNAKRRRPSNEQEDKKELNQEQAGRVKRSKLEEMEDCSTNLVSRGDDTVAEGLDSVSRHLDDLSVGEEEEEDANEDGHVKEVRPSDGEHSRQWARLCGETSSLSRRLTERLRLVIEPTRASRFRGDFRTGKRLNMRRIVPYIASNFRRDKIWLRRTRPSKRDCKILIALDDSSSMSDNKVSVCAFEKLKTEPHSLLLFYIVGARDLVSRVGHPQRSLLRSGGGQPWGRSLWGQVGRGGPS